MRRLAGPAFLLLASCGSSGERQPDQAPQGVAAPGLECAVDGAGDYGDGCTMERQAAADGAVLTLRSPTGSFRRLRIGRDGIAAADGAEPARVIGGDAARVEVAIGRDRYRIPRKLLH